MNKQNLALAICLKYHEGTYRKNSDRVPAAIHPIRVANSLVGDEEKQVAYLHDIIEDTEVSFSDLLGWGFSPEVVDAIVCLTHVDGMSYEEYILNVSRNPLARKVKIHDIQDNYSDAPTTQKILHYSQALQILIDAK